jgi:hypothetical protein
MRAVATTIAIMISASFPYGEARSAGNRVALDWSMRVDGSALVVEYTIVNKTHRQLHVVDMLTKGGKVPLPGRLIVGVEDLLHPGVALSHPRVAFVKKAWAPFASEGIEDLAKVTHLRPGESRHWTATVPLPLTAWAPTGPIEDIDGHVRSVVLLVSYSIGEYEHPDSTIPRGCDKEFIVGKELALPTGVMIVKQPRQ